MEHFSYDLWFAVRYVHVTSVTLLAGGAFMVCALCSAPGLADQSGIALVAATLYEWAFWSIVGIAVATGVSNLGLKGEGLLGPETSWGTALSIKLTAAGFLLILSMVRTDFLIRWKAAAGSRTPGRGHLVLAGLYGLTVAAFLGSLWIGLGLAHGKY